MNEIGVLKLNWFCRCSYLHSRHYSWFCFSFHLLLANSNLHNLVLRVVASLLWTPVRRFVVKLSCVFTFSVHLRSLPQMKENKLLSLLARDKICNFVTDLRLGIEFG